MGQPPRTNGGATLCKKQMNLLFSSVVHISLTLVDVSKNSARSSNAVVRALGLFSGCPKNYMSKLKW